jgi:hypothetical protein
MCTSVRIPPRATPDSIDPRTRCQIERERAAKRTTRLMAEAAQLLAEFDARQAASDPRSSASRRAGARLGGEARRRRVA